MGESEKFKVVLEGSILPNEDREQVIRALSELFHSRPATMEKLLSGKEVSLKKEYPEDEAEKICRAIRDAGAGCRVVPVREPEPSAVSDDSGIDDTHPAEDREDDRRHSIICPGCQQQCDSEWVICLYCGYSFVQDESGGGQLWEDETEGAGVPSGDSAESDEAERDPDGFTPAELARYVGPNAEYYAARFSRMGTIQQPRFRPSWNWPAFFFFFFWALYRKMWLWAGLHLAGAIVLVFITSVSAVWVIYSLLWPVAANYLYFRNFGNHMQMARLQYSGKERLQYLGRKGGVSKNAFWIGLAASFGFSAFSSNMMVNHLVGQYEERFGSRSVGASYLEQVRGDGTVVESIGEPTSPLARTSRVLSTMATGLKVVVAAGNDELVQETLNGLVAKLDNKEILDAWGNPIIVDREPDNVVFMSPGPDGYAGTDDDVLHKVNY